MILAALALFSMPGVADPASHAPSSSKGVTIEHVAGKVYMISGAGGNIGALITNDGILLVDSGTAGTGDAVLEALRTVSDKPVVQIVNTHWHPDHSGGNQSFGSTVTVVTHSRQYARSAHGGSVRGQTIAPATGQRLNAVTFNETTRIYLGDEIVELQLIPQSHSGGDVLVTFHKSGVVQMGDLLFAARLPYADHEDGG
jgi:glyoxylase-like metal-dependent hydrolase (beta-lactamase superfamily II)